jgi:predicted amidohydrolase YtcJ
MMRPFSIPWSLPLLVALSGAVAAPSPGAAKDLAADRIFVGGHVFTGDPALPRAEALAVRGPRILAIGTDKQIRKRSGKATEVVSLNGGWVYPGFDDAHTHFLVVERADLRDAGSLGELRRRLEEFAKRNPASAWVLGRGWAPGDLGGVQPNRKTLDAVVSDRPVWIVDRDGHAGWANTRALEVAEIGKVKDDPPNGAIVRDEKGEPTGLLKEAAMELVSRYVPPPNEQELYDALRALLDRAAAAGLTSVQNASFRPEELGVYERVMRENALKVRFYWAVPMLKSPTSIDLDGYKQLARRYHGPLFKFGAVKGMVDGTVDSRTAAMFDPYVGGGTGLPFWKAEELNETVALYDREGFQILLHAIGDKAIALSLDAFAFAARANGATGRRHRVEHAEVPRPADIPRFRQLGLVVTTTPLFANPDKTALENFAVLLGPERLSRADAFESWDAAGVTQAFGSDWPVTAMEPLRQMYCAVTRQTPDGQPPGGWHPEHRISVEAALRHFTRDAAIASRDETEKGTLAAGKLADFVVLSDDILSPPPERLLRTRVLRTVMGGQDTYRAAGVR